MLGEILKHKLFPFVEKPARYIGKEFGVSTKDPSGRVSIALAYPDMYEVGMSYTGGHLLYHFINNHTDAICERVYTPALDAAALMKKHDIPLFSLENQRPMKDFDMVGFTLAYEMVFTNVLAMLDLAGIPLLCAERKDDDPLIAAGGPICYNPEPMADIIDFFFIGEVEEALTEIFDAVEAGRGAPRRERLRRLAKIESVYVPSFYDPETGKPLEDGIPATITARHVPQLKPEYYPDKPVVPLIEVAHDRVAVEIMRGCPQGCRFCQAGKIYKPVRLRSVAEIKNQVAANIKASGYDEVSLLSLSTTDYPQIESLVASLVTLLEPHKASLSLPSLRPSSFTAKVADAIKQGHKTGLTFAPEVGTERLRQVINKNLREEDLYTAVQIAFEKGWQLVKLYFMLGLPTETDEDIQGIIDVIMKTVRIGRNMKGQRKINVTISPFSPKAHTPFQWDKIASPEEIGRKQDYLKRAMRAREVTLKFRNPQLSYLEGILGRGDRRLGQVIISAYRLGAQFDGWSEHFNFEIWKEAFARHEIAFDKYTREMSFSERLPWDHIDRGQSKEQLCKERSKSSETAFKAIPPKTETVINFELENEDMYGRRKRKLTGPRAVLSPTRGKVRLKWGKAGLVRFLSHLDNNRVFERAIRRAGMPVMYSQGFHPHQKLSFGPPLPHGYSSECEFLDIQIEGNCTAGHLEALVHTLPDGYFIADHKLIYSKAPAISTLLNRAVYQVTGAFGDIELLALGLDALLQKDSIIIRRATKEDSKEMEIRPAVFRLELHKDDPRPLIEMELGLGQGGYARPTEVIGALELFDDETVASMHFHRKALQYLDETGVYLDPLTAIV